MADEDNAPDDEVDPWSGDESNESGGPKRDTLGEPSGDNTTTDPNFQPPDPLHTNPFATNPGIAADTEPQITLRTAEGTQINAPASMQQQYEEMGFEVVVGAEAFGENGTITAQADEEQVAFGQMERKQAEKRLGLAPTKSRS